MTAPAPAPDDQPRRLDHDTALRDKVLNRSGIARPADPAIDGQMDLFGGAA
jgi:hypothetical protein